MIRGSFRQRAGDIEIQVRQPTVPRLLTLIAFPMSLDAIKCVGEVNRRFRIARRFFWPGGTP